jgi:hypothetical protein
MKKLIFIILIVLLFTSCKQRDYTNYTQQECLALKPGDTVYGKFIYSYNKYIVIKNIKERHLLELHSIEHKWDTCITPYSLLENNETN